MPGKVKYFLLLCVLILIAGCGTAKKTSARFQQKAKEIKQKYIPDSRLNVFNVALTRGDSGWVLKGETTVAGARTQVIAFADSLLGKNSYRNELTELPDPALGADTCAVVSISVANMRDRPRSAAQLINQSIMGDVLRLLKKEGGWYYVQTTYGYVGWVSSDSFDPISRQELDRWEEAPKVWVTGLMPLVYSRADENSEPVTDVVLNAKLYRKSNKGRWIKVATPDGRVGFIQSRYASSQYPNRPALDKLRGDIIQTARRMMGFPYMWGGNSSKANDCSGFTRTVFQANGIDLPRDAFQQAKIGREILPDSTFSNILPGDLLFFGTKERITHVGISLGAMDFIHQSGRVHVSSLDSLSDVFSPYRKKHLQKIMRVLE